MKLGRIAAGAAASIIAAAAIGVGGTGTASAATQFAYLCILDQSANTICAYGHGPNAIGMIPETGSTTNWYYPGIGGSGTIQQVNTHLCMQLDHNAGNIVIEAACNPNATYQQWTNFADLNTPMTFISVWDPSLCLTYEQSGKILKVGGCSNLSEDPIWYQAFFTA